MRELTNIESNYVAAGITISDHANSNYDEFWMAYFQGAGWGAGAISSIPIAIGMATYAVAYYGVYLPISYMVTGVYLSGVYVVDSFKAGAHAIFNFSA